MLSATLREKSTDNLNFELLADGAAINLTGVDHIELHMIDSAKKTYRYSTDDSSPAVTITSITGGTLQFIPPSATVFLYRRSPYKLYFQIFDSATQKYSIPEEDRFELKILKEF